MRPLFRLVAASASVELFVAALGASNYTYAEVTWSQSLPDWIALIRGFRPSDFQRTYFHPDNELARRAVIREAASAPPSRRRPGRSR